MDTQQHQYARVLKHPFRFLWQCVKGFRANQGLLLAGAIAYYALLSIVPLITLILLVLSNVVETNLLVETLRQHIELVVPAQADVIVQQMAQFMDHRGVFGWLLIGLLLFFSSMAFTMLENAMSFIFFHRVKIRRRHFLVSAILPYVYIFVMGVGFLIMTLVSGALQAVETRDIALFGYIWSFEGVSKVTLYLLGVTGQILILTSFYLVLPVGKLSFRHALVGGITAGLLWEVMRHMLVWYFSTLSVVNVVYGSLGTAIIVLLSLEVAGIILLFGAQVIAEYERFGINGGGIEPARTD